jgi:hypothetical protein
MRYLPEDSVQTDHFTLTLIYDPTPDEIARARQLSARAEEPQTAASFAGRVTDPTLAQLSGVRIEVVALGAESPSIQRTISDAGGRFSLPLPDGAYEVRFTLAGFAVTTIHLTIDSKIEREEMQVVLRPAAATT